jgi:RND family efflux transporter MFP subunit
MRALSVVLKALNLRGVGAVAAILVVAVGATYGAYALTSGSGQASASENQQIIPVQYGDLVIQVSTNGSLNFPNRETLTFGTAGTVGEVLVVEGQRVKEGQALGKLDAATVTLLEVAVAQARVDLQSAEETLKRAGGPHTALEIAEAEAGVANADLALGDANDALSAMLRPTAMDTARAEAAVISAKLSVESAQRAVDDVTTDAQSAVDSASATMANALGDLKLAQREWDDTLKTAQDAFDTALEGYQATYRNWLGIALSEENVSLGPDDLLESWGVDLDALFDPDSRFQDIDTWPLPDGPPLDDAATPWSEPVIYSWLNFYPGTIASTCEDGVAPREGVCIKKEMDDAWTAYQEASDDLDTAWTQAAKAVSTAESAATGAEGVLAAARETLADVQDSSASLAVRDKESDVSLARAALREAEEEMTQLPTPDPLDVAANRNLVAVAQVTLAEATEDLAGMLGGVDTLEVALREADLASAQQSLETAARRLEGSTLLAPMAGTISWVEMEAGKEVAAGAQVLEIVDPTVVEVDGIVDEIDVLLIYEGARAAVTMDALAGRVMEGIVSDISAEATNQQGVVSYPVRIRLEAPKGVTLYEGLSATASIMVREERNVLLVPSQAVFGTFQKPFVRVMTGGNIEERGVVLGNSDGLWTAVREGLTEGDRVVMESIGATPLQSGLATLKTIIPAGGVKSSSSSKGQSTGK